MNPVVRSFASPEAKVGTDNSNGQGVHRAGGEKSQFTTPMRVAVNVAATLEPIASAPGFAAQREFHFCAGAMAG